MCGIFGIFVTPEADLRTGDIAWTVKQLFLLSESRGKEAAGLAFSSEKDGAVFKTALAPSQVVHQPRYKELINTFCSPKSLGSNGRAGRLMTMIGHARLVTDGLQINNANNQPVISSKATGVHNGIVVNVDALWQQHSDLERQCEVDTEIILALIQKYAAKGDPLSDAVAKTYGVIKGSASVAILLDGRDDVILATNTGSLFLCRNRERNLCYFSSERYITETIAQGKRMEKMLGAHDIWQLKPGQGCLLDRKTLEIQDFQLKAATYVPAPIDKKGGRKSAPAPQTSNVRPMTFDIPPLKRCTRCILPETVPYIEFDDQGVCNFCRGYEKKTYLGPKALEETTAPYRSQDGRPDCLIGLSGGRDSSYALHYFKTVLKMNPIAYTYDWGMVTDLARRNQARMCGKLGVEHIIVSADIERKRKYIRKNINAWLKKPDLGIIPLFMAGDKQYFAYAHKLRKQTGIKLVIWCSNYQLENCVFKAGFAGVNLGRRMVWNVSILEKMKIVLHYTKAFLKNPSYLNSSLWDTVVSFYWSWFAPHDFLFFYNYIPWDEHEIVSTLRREYEWEIDDGTASTWRIGDGTAAFYNYIYYKVGGVTEHDTFRSNQIREDMIDRREALKLVADENQPRYDSLEWYAEKNGFDLDAALRVINAIPTIY